MALSFGAISLSDRVRVQVQNEEAEAQQHLVTEWAEFGQGEEMVVNSVTGTPWRLADGQRIVDRPQVRVDAVPVSGGDK